MRPSLALAILALLLVPAAAEAAGRGQGRLGVHVQPMTPALRAYFDAPEDRGVLVARVEPGSPAGDAGVEAGDVDAILVPYGGGGLSTGIAVAAKDAKPDTVEAWGRSSDNPVGGWYGLKKGLRGRFGNYVPPVLEALGLAEVEHNARNNRMRAI